MFFKKINLVKDLHWKNSLYDLPTPFPILLFFTFFDNHLLGKKYKNDVILFFRKIFLNVFLKKKKNFKFKRNVFRVERL
jgi:hypothetical protein